MEWGLVPHWSADGKNSGKLINASAEGIAEKPSFREPIHSKRCLVPADRFYEWRKQSGGRKIPYRIFLENEDLVFLAGIWDEWELGGIKKHSFPIITTPPNRDMSDLHDRMPVVLPYAAAQKLWLGSLPLNEALALLHPLQDGRHSMYRVSEKLNKPGYDKPNLHETLPEELTLF